MTEQLLIGLIILVLITIILLIILIIRSTRNPFGKLENQFNSLEKNLERNERLVNGEISKNREESNNNARQVREELNQSVRSFNDSVLARMAEIANLQRNQLDIFATQLSSLTKTNDLKLEQMRKTVEERLLLLQQDNGQRLDQMRATVDEKLSATLEQRLGESFKLVSERLEAVHKGLGEMQTLASGVGDLKKVLTNVKTRGIWGEIQLGSLLEQILTPEQYSSNVTTKAGSNDRVEFAIKLPARDGQDNIIWLPIDAKFPIEDYERLIEAQDQANLPRIEELGKSLENRIKLEGKTIRDKYIDPPNTTDFGILFLPVEGLYAEVLRRPGLCELLQREYRVIITGPTTLAALLNSLQMGFKTLAIEKRSSEVWNLLSAVKTEFGKFVEILEKTQKKLQEASNTIDTATRKSRTIARKLKDVQTLPASEADLMLDNEREHEE
ncbi:DNA recombination protein RmuC [Desulfosporosinus nitroreducens]|uniref:DNA recombination protein RmuC n=1 Tax=Desulfosporosinus nitroreducens TaxID=2018668 RepID=A0ABT8QW07_9FIRM|nr:DNA recombination protein RmuC [Desulfosporosinus nitroreducens]MDO0824238.1 DNA recombination protein RmuC [Desulfosporosinus nitroreducens]